MAQLKRKSMGANAAFRRAKRMAQVGKKVCYVIYDQVRKEYAAQDICPDIAIGENHIKTVFPTKNIQIRALKEIIQKLLEEMKTIDDNKCDHSVGICWCEWNSTMYFADLLIKDYMHITVFNKQKEGNNGNKNREDSGNG